MSENRTYQTKRMKVGAVEWQPELMIFKPLPLCAGLVHGRRSEGLPPQAL